MLVTGAVEAFIKNNYPSHVLQSDFEKTGIFLRLVYKSSTLFRQYCCSMTNLSSGLEARLSAKVDPADTKLLEAKKVIKKKNTLDIKQEV